MDMANEWEGVEVSRVDAQDTLDAARRAVTGCSAALLALMYGGEPPAGYGELLLLLSGKLDEVVASLRELSAALG